jgi:hypothetical protein
VRPYSELPVLSDYYLEDSFVLAIRETADEVRFVLEAVLTPTHPKWSPPNPGEVHPYLKVELVFPSVQRVNWIKRKMTPIGGPGGEIDYGNIDRFEWEPRWFELQGEWGHVQIESETPAVTESERLG